MASHESYYDATGSMRSTSGQHHNTLHRASSRQFETFAGQTGLYTAEDHAARYDHGRAYDTTRIAPTAMTYGGYEASGAQTWNPSSFGNVGTLGGTMGGGSGRIKGPSRQRSALPSVRTPSIERGIRERERERETDTAADGKQMWTESPSALPAVSPLAAMGGGGGGVPLGASPMRQEPVGSDMGEEELIPTAIVIKNIPFAVKKEQLVQLMTEISLPLPYAFNYHFDNGVFRGLAFANFTTAEETGAVIDMLNGFELQGRKLRVEYKKMLPIQERERIEREKRERRGQLEEQHRPVTQPPPPATSPTPGTSRSKPGQTTVILRTEMFRYSSVLTAFQT